MPAVALGEGAGAGGWAVVQQILPRENRGAVATLLWQLLVTCTRTVRPVSFSLHLAAWALFSVTLMLLPCGKGAELSEACQPFLLTLIFCSLS